MGSAPGRAPPAKPPNPPAPNNGNHHPTSPTTVEPAPGSSVPTQAYPIPPPKAAPPLDPKQETKARRLIQRGRALYKKGEYEKAEVVLKEAVTLYPFVAEANLALGKIFLIRGSATRDRAMINSARLMFEMARALDPNLREPAVLLELFLAAPPE